MLRRINKKISSLSRKMRKKRAEHANWLMTTRQFRLEVCKAKCRTAQWQPGLKGGGEEREEVCGRPRRLVTHSSSTKPTQAHTMKKALKCGQSPSWAELRRCFLPHTTWRTLVLSTYLPFSLPPSLHFSLSFLCALAVALPQLSLNNK